jgi:hypothetical protein
MTVTEAAGVPPVAPLAAAVKTKKKQPDLSLGMLETNCIIVDFILFLELDFNLFLRVLQLLLSFCT